MKNRIIRIIRKIFEYEVRDYFNPLRVGNIWFKDHIEYENNGDRNKTLLVNSAS